MKIPNREYAYVPLSKLQGYLLSETHPVGGSKARFFRALDFTEDNVDVLEESLIAIAHAEEVSQMASSPYGEKYVIEGALRTPTEDVFRPEQSGLSRSARCDRAS